MVCNDVRQIADYVLLPERITGLPSQGDEVREGVEDD